jgi:hypothetical protein
MAGAAAPTPGTTSASIAVRSPGVLAILTSAPTAVRACSMLTMLPAP